MATKAIQPMNNGAGTNRGRRLDRKGKRERCRTQVYEGHYKIEPQRQDNSDSDQSQTSYRPRHKSSDPLDARLKRRSLPSGPEDLVGSESGSAEDDRRNSWTKNSPQSRRAKKAERTGRSERRQISGGPDTNGNSVSSHQHRGSLGSSSSQKSLNVPGSSVFGQPSSDSALYTRPKVTSQSNDSTNGSRNRFHKLEERRRQRLELAITSDEEGNHDSGTPPYSRQPTLQPKGQAENTLTNGQFSSTVQLHHQPKGAQIAIAQNYHANNSVTPPRVHNGTNSLNIGHSSVTASPHNPDSSVTQPVADSCQDSSVTQPVADSCQDIIVKRPVSLLKAQFEKQAQSQTASPTPSRPVQKVVTTGGASCKPPRQTSSLNNNLVAGARSEPVKTRDVPKQLHLSVVPNKKVNHVAPTQQMQKTQPGTLTTNIPGFRSVLPPNLSASLSQQPAQVSPSQSRQSTQVSAGQSQQLMRDSQTRRLPTKDHNFNDADSLDELLESNKDYLGFVPNDKPAQVKSTVKQAIKTIHQTGGEKVPPTSGVLYGQTMGEKVPPACGALYGQTVSQLKPSDQKIRMTTVAGRDSVPSATNARQHKFMVNSSEPSSTISNPTLGKGGAGVQQSTHSPGSDTMEDLWIPRRSRPLEENLANERKEMYNLSVNIKKVPNVPKKPQRSFTYEPPRMIVTDVQALPDSVVDLSVFSQLPAQHQQLLHTHDLAVPFLEVGMFSDVDYNIEVSERVKKWETLMQEKNLPPRKNEMPDKVSLVESGDPGTAEKPSSPRSRAFPGARLPVIDEYSFEAGNVFSHPVKSVTSHSRSGIVSNSGGDLMLSQSQMWTYPHSKTMLSSPPKTKVGPQHSVRHERQKTYFGDEPWASDWYFKVQPTAWSVDNNETRTSGEIMYHETSITRSEMSPQRWNVNAASFGSSPTMTRKIVYEPVTGSDSKLVPPLGTWSDGDTAHTHLYSPVKPDIKAALATKTASPEKVAPRPTKLSLQTGAGHRRQDSDEQIWKEIEKMTSYAREIAWTSAVPSRSHSQSSLTKPSPTRKSAYEPLTSQKAMPNLLAPLSIEVSSPTKTRHFRYEKAEGNAPMRANAKIFQPQLSPKGKATKPIRYRHVPVADKYQRPEALDEVLEEITSSLEKKPFSPKSKSPVMSSSSHWSSGTPDKPPLSPDVFTLTAGHQQMKSLLAHHRDNPLGGRPSSLAFPPSQEPFLAAPGKDYDRRHFERQPRFLNLAHGKEYQLDLSLLKEKLLGTGLVERCHTDDEQHTDTGSYKTAESDSGSQPSVQRMNHVNKAIRELRHLASEVEDKIGMIKSRLLSTKEDDLDTVLTTLKRCSSNLASAKSDHVVSSASAKSRKSKLSDALSELERIYESLDLKDGDLTDGSARHEYPLLQSKSKWGNTSATDVSSLGSYPQSSSEMYTDTYLTDYNQLHWQTASVSYKEQKSRSHHQNDGLARLTEALNNESWFQTSRYRMDSSCDSWSGDLQAQDGEDTPRAVTYNDPVPDQQISELADWKYQPSSDVKGTASEQYSSDDPGRRHRARSRNKTADIIYGDVAYRKIRTKSATRVDLDSPNMSPSTATDYLAARTKSEALIRDRIRPEKEPDVLHDDLAYRNLRHDLPADHPKPPPRSSSLHRKSSGKKSDEVDESDSDFHQLCNAETQTCDIEVSKVGGESRRPRREGQPQERSYANRRQMKEEQSRRRSLGKGVAKMVERFSSSEDERQQNPRLVHSRSAPDLMEQSLYRATYDENGDIISTETDTNKEDEAPAQPTSNKAENSAKSASLPSKSLTPRSVKQRHEAKTKVRISNQAEMDNKNVQKTAGETKSNLKGKLILKSKSIQKAKAAARLVSSSDQTPIVSSCEGSPGPARLLIHRRTKKVPMATISTTSTSGEDSASGNKPVGQATMVLPQGGVIKRQAPRDLPKGMAVRLRSKESQVPRQEREERSRSFPELFSQFEPDPERIRAILGTLRKSASVGAVLTQHMDNTSFHSEPNLTKSNTQAATISKESLLLKWKETRETQKEIFC